MKVGSSAVALGLVLSPGVALAQYGYPPAQAQGQGLQAGGLAPPSGSTTDEESAQTEAKLENADKEDSGRGLEWFYLNAEAGVEHLGLQTFHANHLVDSKVVDTTQTGFLFGAGLGVRLVFLTIGPRFRLASFSKYQVWTLDGEVGLRIPLGNIEPYLTLAGGYASLGSFSASDVGGASASAVSIAGYDIRAGGGVDVYVTPVFSVGGALTGELLGLTRPGVNPAQLTNVSGSATQSGAAATANNVYKADGSSLGFGVTATAVAGLHF